MIADWFRKLGGIKAEAPTYAKTSADIVAGAEELRAASELNVAAAREVKEAAERRFLAAEDLHILLVRTLSRLTPPP